MSYRHRQIDPYLDLFEKVILDFSGVRSANSSFMNALISGLLEQHGDEVLEKLVFKSCKPAIAVLVEAAIELGISKSVARIAACAASEGDLLEAIEAFRAICKRGFPYLTNNLTDA